MGTVNNRFIVTVCGTCYYVQVENTETTKEKSKQNILKHEEEYFEAKAKQIYVKEERKPDYGRL